MNLTRWVFGAWAIGILCSVSSARAQAPAPRISLQAEAVTHSVRRGNGLRPSQINAADCRNNDMLDFPFTLSGSQGYSLQAWAGAQCETVTARVTKDQQQCWQLASLPATDGAHRLDIPVRDILYGRTAAGDPARGPLGKPAQLDPTVACESRTGSGAPEIVSVYFMLVDSAEGIVGEFATWNATYKLVGPPPPDLVAAGIGPEELVLAFRYSTLPADTTIAGYRIYCDPAPGVSHEGPPTAADPGVCRPSSLLVAGADSSLIAAQRCGSAGKTASTATAGWLSAGVAYNVAVTAVDSYDNESVLSPVVCEVPMVKAERQAMSSSACAFSTRPQTLPLLVLLSLASFLVARRRFAVFKV